MLGQWALEMNHVAAIVGGFSSQQKHVGPDGRPLHARFRARDRQAAVKFLDDNAFKTPTWAINPEILRRIEPVGVLDRIEASQTRVLNSLLSSARIARLVEQEALDGAAAYRAARLPRRRPQGVWSELYGARAGQDRRLPPQPAARLRRDAQRPDQRRARPQSDDARAFFRGELKTLDADLRRRWHVRLDRATRLHIDDVRTQIARALDPAVQASAGRRPHRRRTWRTTRCSTSRGRAICAGPITR